MVHLDYLERKGTKLKKMKKKENNDGKAREEETEYKEMRNNDKVCLFKRETKGGRTGRIW